MIGDAHGPRSSSIELLMENPDAVKVGLAEDDDDDDEEALIDAISVLEEEFGVHDEVVLPSPPILCFADPNLVGSGYSDGDHLPGCGHRVWDALRPKS